MLEGAMDIEEGDPDDLGPKVNAGLYVPKWLLERIDALAKEMHYKSRNALMTKVLRQFVRDREAQKPHAERKSGRK